MNRKIKSAHDNEIDLLKLAIKIWKNKSQVILITAVTVIITYSIQFLNKSTPRYLAITEIQPISTFDELEYQFFNSYLNKSNFQYSYETELNAKLPNDTIKSFQKIEKKYLIDLFVDQLKSIIFRDTIKKLNFIKKENYKDENTYEAASIRLASSIKLMRNENTWLIQFETDDKSSWQNFLKTSEKLANEEVKFYLTKNFENFILDEKNIKQFKIEDIETRMKDALENYEITIKRRLSFLNEQAIIARELDLPKSNFQYPLKNYNQNSIVSSLALKAENMPYYLRGYEAIEKEIDLIKNRDDKEAFTPDFELLEIQKRNIESNKDIQRLENLFKKTPIFKSNNFYAAKIISQSTRYKVANKKNKSLELILSGIFGLVLSLIYLLIKNTKFNRN